MANTSHQEVLSVEATVTSRGQATIPSAIRKALELGASDKINFILHSDNTVTVSKVVVGLDSDPLVEKFLAFLEQDMLSYPEQIQPITPGMVARLNALVGDIRVDLDAPLDDEDE